MSEVIPGFNSCITSPPYFGQRDYGHGDQIGLEADPRDYIRNLMVVFDQVMDKMADDGTLWVNIADSYVSHGGKRNDYSTYNSNNPDSEDRYDRFKILKSLGYKPKDLIGIPWMLASALRESGWYLRQDLIWHKRNPLPEPVRDRCVKSFEYIFLLSKSKNYYFDYEAIREDAKRNSSGNTSRVSPKGRNIPDGSGGNLGSSVPWTGEKSNKRNVWVDDSAYYPTWDYLKDKLEPTVYNSLLQEFMDKTLPAQDVWPVSTTSFRHAHTATFPRELARTMILASTKPEDTVLDPFGGTLTVNSVCRELSRNSVSIELVEDFANIGHNVNHKLFGLFQ